MLRIKGLHVNDPASPPLVFFYLIMSNLAVPSLGIHYGRSEVEPIDSDAVPFWVSELTTVQYFQVVITTVLIFDAREFRTSCILTYLSHRK